MTLGEFDPWSVVGQIERIIGDSSKRLRTTSIAVVGGWFVKLPGMRPRAPKRNVIVCLVYLYAVVVLASAGPIR
jgi:hypothetical protein